MESSIDLPTIALLVSVIALFVWFFWHTAYSMIKSAKNIAAIVDSSAARERLELEHEAKFGPRPLWYRAAQKIVLAVLFTGAAWLLWTLVQGG
jgi:uncharacterized ion transporter superfamily protein YfcC